MRVPSNIEVRQSRPCVLLYAIDLRFACHVTLTPVACDDNSVIGDSNCSRMQVIEEQRLPTNRSSVLIKLVESICILNDKDFRASFSEYPRRRHNDWLLRRVDPHCELLVLSLSCVIVTQETLAVVIPDFTVTSAIKEREGLQQSWHVLVVEPSIDLLHPGLV